MVSLPRLRPIGFATESNPVQLQFFSLRQEHQPPFMFVDNDVVYTNVGLLLKGEKQGSEQEDCSYRNSHRNGILSPVTIVAISQLHSSSPARGVLSVMAFYEKVIKVKADVAAYLINCFPSA